MMKSGDDPWVEAHPSLCLYYSIAIQICNGYARGKPRHLYIFYVGAHRRLTHYGIIAHHSHLQAESFHREAMHVSTILTALLMAVVASAVPTPEAAEQDAAAVITMTAFQDSDWRGPSIGLRVQTQTECCSCPPFIASV
jgi:hypothetical protein